MSKPLRRFRPQGTTGKERKLIEDPIGTFMLYGDHCDRISEERERTRMWEIACESRDRIIAQLREELREATSPDREPDWFIVKNGLGKAVSVWPTAPLASGAADAKAYLTGVSHSIESAWSTHK